MSDYQLREYDEDEPLDSAELGAARDAFLVAADEAWERHAENVAFHDDNGNPLDHSLTYDDWGAEFAGSSKYGELVASKYDALFEALDEDKIRELYDIHKDASKAAEVFIVELLVNIQHIVDPTVAPDGTDLTNVPIEEQISEDPDQEAINANARRNDAALAEQAKNAASGSAGTSTADSFSFKEQCFLASKMVDIIKHKDKTISRYKKLPYVAGSPQTNDMISNASIMVHDDPFHFINRLLVYPDTEAYFDMRSEEIANLQPEIRFFKTTFTSIFKPGGVEGAKLITPVELL